MRWTIAYKLFFALVLISVVTLALSSLLSRLSFERAFLAYKSDQDVELLAEMSVGFAQYFQRNGSWLELGDDPRLFLELSKLGANRSTQRSRPGPPPRRQGARPPAPRDGFQRGQRSPGPPPRGGPPPNDSMNIGSRLGLFDGAGILIAGVDVKPIEGSSRPVIVDDAQVGELRLAPATILTEAIDLRFAQGQSRSLLWISIAVLGFATLAALVLARQMTRPIKALVTRARAMTAGDYEDSLVVGGTGELHELAQDFNTLARTLESNRQSRKHWMTDISHELRTPLAILTAELQALEDGVREYNAGTRASLQLEVQRLNRLVHDLYELSASDEGTLSVRLSPTDIGAVLKETLVGASERILNQGLTLDFAKAEAGLTILADQTRLMQLFTNLIENSLRYTKVPGELRVACERVGETVEIVFEDSAPGVPDHLLPRIFERLYRVEPSRGRHSGGSGLGLSICKAIVDAHHGELSASASSLGGLLVRVAFPLLKTQD